MDDLDEVDLGDGVVQRPTYVCCNLTAEQKEMMYKLLRE
jgi:hypothetical protein